jgi:predicted ester cyclase
MSCVCCFSKFSIIYRIIYIVKENNKIVRRFSVTANRSGALIGVQDNNRDVKFEGIQYNNLMIIIKMKSGRSWF